MRRPAADSAWAELYRALPLHAWLAIGLSAAIVALALLGNAFANLILKVFG